MNSFTVLRVPASFLVLLSAWSQIADAVEPAAHKDTPQAIFAAARQSCESLRSGHFIMTGLHTIDDAGADPNQVMAPGEKKTEREIIPQVQLKYWFDVDKDLWRIELTSDGKPGSNPHPFVATLSADRIVSGSWNTLSNGERTLWLQKGSRATSFDKLERSSILFNVQTLHRIPTSRFFGVGTQKSDFKTPKQCFPNLDDNSGIDVTLSSDKEVVLVRRQEVPDAPGIAIIIEWGFLRSTSILPTRIELIQDQGNNERYVQQSTNIEWSERDGVHVPVRYFGHSGGAQKYGDHHPTCDFDLNWISVNKPIDPEVFDVEKQELAKRTISSIHDLDTGTTINPLAARLEGMQSRFEDRKASVKSERILYLGAVLVVAAGIVGGLVWFVRRNGSTGVR